MTWSEFCFVFWTVRFQQGDGPRLPTRSGLGVHTASPKKSHRQLASSASPTNCPKERKMTSTTQRVVHKPAHYVCSIQKPPFGWSWDNLVLLLALFLAASTTNQPTNQLTTLLFTPLPTLLPALLFSPGHPSPPAPAPGPPAPPRWTRAPASAARRCARVACGGRRSTKNGKEENGRDRVWDRVFESLQFGN